MHQVLNRATTAAAPTGDEGAAAGTDEPSLQLAAVDEWRHLLLQISALRNLSDSERAAYAALHARVSNRCVQSA